MQQASLVSIALCTYNGAKFLSQQLDTLVNQTYQPLEIIAVDDCSTDDTFAILAEYAGRYPNFKIYRNEVNLGFTENFEKAVKLCTGDLIALCDQDDLWDPKKIELQVNALNDHVLIYHDSEFIRDDGTSMHKKMSELMNFYRGGDPEVFLFFNCISGHSMLMKRELIDDALPLKPGYFHDWWLAYVATNIGTIDFIPQRLVKYRQHEKSDTNILRLEREKNAYMFSSVQKIEREQKWLGYCAAFKKNKHPALVKEIYDAFSQRLENYLSFSLARLLYKHRKIMFCIRKKSSLSNLSYIYRSVWGVKTKKLFQ
jgi:glycosyltransferase involved in cell wall biosynthesis